jgi:hypothetical protein
MNLTFTSIAGCFKNIFTVLFQMLLCGEYYENIYTWSVKSIHLWMRWTDSLYAFKCKCFRNIRHGVTFGKFFLEHPVHFLSLNHWWSRLHQWGTLRSEISLASYEVLVQNFHSGHYISGGILVVASCQSQIQSLKLLQILGLFSPASLSSLSNELCPWYKRLSCLGWFMLSS